MKISSPNHISSPRFLLVHGPALWPLICTAILAWSIAASAQTSITVNGTNSGREFYGIGAISGGGGNSRLLYDYPSTQQSDILDYLFKPGAGANLQVLKVEIGGGNDSTDGAESTIEPTQGAVNCNTGYEWWLMEQAVARNPNIKLYALPWAAPGWLGGWWNNNATDYLVSYMDCAKSHGLTINYLGGFNETQGDGTASWWEGLRSTLNSDGYTSTQFVGGDDYDGFGGISNALLNNSNWAADMPFVGDHYPCAGGDGGSANSCPVTGAPISLGKPLWQSEGGSQDYNSGAPAVIRSIVRGYIDGTMVEFNNWPIMAAIYPGLPWDTAGLLWANSPWSGWYSVGKTTWVIAHVTQFTQPGWTFINSASGYLNGNEQNGTYVTLKSPDGTDYSTIIETSTATTSQTVKISVSGGLSTGTVQVWATNLGSSNAANWFVQQASISPSGGSYSLTLQPNYVYSISTITGQGKSTATTPASVQMGLPYTDSFSGYAIGGEAKYLAQMEGDFQSQPCEGKTGNCIMQVLPETPSIFFYTPGTPWAMLGDQSWTNYTVSMDALIEQAGTVFLAGRVTSPGYTNAGSNLPNHFNGYVIQINNSGAWSLFSNSTSSSPTTLASGYVAAPGLNAWVPLSLTFNGSTVSASINGNQVASVSNSNYSAGQVGLGVEGWQTAQYSNLSISSGTTVCTPTAIVPYVSVNGGTSWSEVNTATVTSTSALVDLGPQPLSGGSWNWTGPNGYTSTLREIDSIPLSAGPNVYVATYTNSCGDKSTETFTITAGSTSTGGFSLKPSASALTVPQGTSGTDTITITDVSPFAGSVALAASGLPSGVTASFSPAASTSSSVLTLAAGSTATTGAYTVTVTGTSGSITASTTLTLNVTASVVGSACTVDYTISPQDSSNFGAAITIKNGGTTTLSNWVLTWGFANGQTISSSWNGTVAQSGANVTASEQSGQSWQNIPAGGSYSGFGFNGTWNGTTNAIPTAFSLNGTACTVN